MTRPDNGKKKPIEWDGVVYPSMAALSRALGLSRSRVSNAKRLGKMHTLGIGSKAGWVLGQNLGLKAMHDAKRQPVAALGWYWPSQLAAADAMGVHHSCISNWLRRGTLEKNVLKRLGVKT